MNQVNIKDKAEYIIATISEFGKRHTLSPMVAFRYLKRFKGLDMLDQFYDVMHTQSFRDVTDDLTAYCHRQGGALV